MGAASRLGAAAMVCLAAHACLAAFAAGEERAAGPDSVVAKWPSWPFPTVCGDLPFDPVAAFSGPTGVERGSRPSERALGRFLRTQKWIGGFVPIRDWRLLGETATSAEFASGRLTPFGPSVMSFGRVRGRWKLQGLSSACEPTSVVDDLLAISWRLAPDKPLPKPGGRRIWIELGPGECSSGRSQNQRVREPVVWRVGGKLLIAMTLRPLPPGGYTCEGLIEPPLAIALPQPLGTLRLFDGATYPPTDVVRQWRQARAQGAARR